MYASAEVRWIHEGSLPDSIAAWFEASAGLTKAQTRTDRYIRPAGEDGLNVKWREGGLEVKRLSEVLGVETLASGVEGRLERWRKWRFPLAEGGTLMDPEQEWVAVSKTRRVATFTLHDGVIRRAADGHWLEAGCGVEIAEMKARGETAWSVCLEAFGPDRVEILRRTASHVFGDGVPEGLDAAHSQSYVGWIYRLGQAKQPA